MLKLSTFKYSTY